MSNYGFVTYDPHRKNRKLGIINSKWPIFGPRYRDISTCYKTFHISDRTTNVASAVNLNPSTPSNMGSSYKKFSENQEVFRVEHGFKKRPLGYATFVGNVVKNTRCYINQYHENGSAAYGGDFTLNGVNTAVIPTVSSLQGELEGAYTSTSYDVYSNTMRDTVFTVYDGSTYFPRGNLLVPSGTPSRVKTTYVLPWVDPEYPDDDPVPGRGQSLPPYYVEIDDKYVILYRRLYKIDWLFRTDSGSTRVYDRVKGVSDYAGTELDMTVYLCPYSMEDLL